MKSLRRFAHCAALCCGLATPMLTAAENEWDLVQAFDASTHVFYGELEKSLPVLNLRTGATGVHIKEIDEEALKLEAIVWPKAMELFASVDVSFKQPPSQNFTFFVADPHPDIWTHVVNAAGDLSLVQPQTPDPLFEKLRPGDRGLFFVRDFPGTGIPVLYRIRLGQDARDDLALLRMHKAAGDVPLASVVAQARAREAAIARQEAAEAKKFEDEYYKILRIQDLDIRTSLLKDLVERMGFEGRWSYYEFKDRYLKEHGPHTPDSAVPPGPTAGKEKLWHDISGELRKIEVIQEARKAGK